MSELHPLDFGSLNKGELVRHEQIERIYNVRRAASPDAYRLCQLRLVSDIEQHRSDLLARCLGDDVKVMTDAEADEHTWEQYERGVRKIGRAGRRRGAIDHAQLGNMERKTAEFRDGHVTMQALMNRKALAKANRELLLAAGPDEAAE